ncbi:MAG: hypothetical protein AB1921_01505 [Thermodesulfobacteriota bacterium]
MRPILFLLLVTGWALQPAAAGNYSDHYSRKDAAQGSANTAVQYGGTYGQAGTNAVNNRDNWAVPGPAGTGDGKGMTPEEKAKVQELLDKTDRMLKNMVENPVTFGPSGTTYGSPPQDTETLIHQSDDLLQRIENDPMLK